MALNSIIGSSVSGLLTSQEALRVTSNNITNVNTPGYARQQVSTEANVAGTITAGVDIASIERVVDRFLDAATLAATSDASRFGAKSQLHDRLQTSLGSPDSNSNPSARMNAVFEALGALALAPVEGVARQQFISALGGYAGEVSRLSGELQALRGNASDRIATETERASSALEQIFDLNRRIVEQRARGGDVAGLENRRQSALTELSEVVGIKTIQNADGSIDVSTFTGAQLVTRSFFARLEYESPGAVGPQTRFPPIFLTRIDPISGAPKGTPRAIDVDIRSGSLRGLLDMRDVELVGMSVALGELAARVADEINAVHNLHAAVPPPDSLTGKATPFTGTDPHNFSGEATFAVVDTANQVVATTTYDFDANPGATLDDMIAAVNAGLGGAATLDLSGGVMSLTAAAPDNGVIIAEDPANMSDRAGRSFSHFFGMNDLLTGRSAGIFETGVQPTDPHNVVSGTIEFAVTTAEGRPVTSVTLDPATVAPPSFQGLVDALNGPSALGSHFTFSLDSRGGLSATPVNGKAGLTLAVAQDSTDVGGTGIGLAAMFGLGDEHRANAAVDFRLAHDAAVATERLATARFDVASAVGATALSVGDQRGAQALQELEGKVVASRAAGELASQNRTLSSLNGAVLGNFALIADRAATAADDNEALRIDVDLQRQSVSGVNLDEELSNLVVFQNSYNAAARILTTVQQLFDSLLAAV